ncbi:serine/threonine-protein kinase mTOR-like [Styela clava]
MSAVQQFVQGLKSRNEETRLNTALSLQHYINTEVRELANEQAAKFMNELNHQIFEMMSSSDNNEKKGGILAIVSQIGVEDGTHFPLYRAANYLRNLFPSSDVVVMEMAAQALGRLAAAGGNHRTEYIEFQVRRAIEWIGAPRNEGRRHSAVLILRELAINAPTIFYLQIQPFFDDIFNVARDPKPSIREGAVAALRAALQLTVHRETKDPQQKPYWYKQTFDEAMNGFEEPSHKDKSNNSSKDDRIHASLLILNELLRIGTRTSQIMLEEAMDRVNIIQDQPRKSGKSALRSAASGRSSSNSASASSLLLSSYKPTSGSQSVIRLADAAGTYCAVRSLGNLLSSSASKIGISDSQNIMESLHCIQQVQDHYIKICSEVLACRTSRNQLVQQSLLSLLPRLAASNPESFSGHFLDDAMAFVLSCLKKDRDRSSGFYAVGLIGLSVKKNIAVYMSKILEYIKTCLPNKDIPAKKQRNFVLEPAVFSCISMLAEADPDSITSHIEQHLLQPMLTVGLNSALMVALHDLSTKIPILKKRIREGVINILSLVLLNQPGKLPNGKEMNSTSIVLPNTVDPTDSSNLVLALRTLAMFRFSDLSNNQNIWERTPSHLIMQFAKECSSSKFLRHDDIEVRTEAVITTTTLLRPYIPPHVTTANNIRLYPNLLPGIAKVLEDVLNLAITDKDSDVRCDVLYLLNDRFDCYLAQPENLSTLFIANHDEVFEVREAAVRTIGRLAEHNPAYVMPFLRKTLIELLSELQHSGVGRNKLQSSRLLGHLACTAPLLIRPYVHTTMQALIEELKVNESNSAVIVGVMQTVGDFAEVGGSDIGVNSVIDQLMPIILEMLQALSNYAKREVALVTLGKLVQSTGYVVDPYQKYPKLLDILLTFLKTEQSLTFRKEVIKVLGLIGALDPFKHKVNQGEINLTETDVVTMPEHKDIEQDGGTSEMLITLGTSSEEFYLAVAVTTLMRVLKDPLLSTHHMDVIQAIDYMFKSLGVKCVSYLPQIIPTYLATIRSCDPNIREFLFKNLGIIVFTVKQHVRNFMDEIFDVIKEYWTVGSSMQGTLILLTEQIASALAADFKIYLPQVVPHALKVFIHDDSLGKSVTLKMLHALQVFSTNLDTFIHLFLPPVIRLLDSAESPVNIRRAAIETIQIWSECVDLREHMSQLVLPISRVISSIPDLRPPSMDALAALVCQFGTKFAVFVPMINNLIEKHKILHSEYDKMVSKVMLAQDELDSGIFLWTGHPKSQENSSLSGVAEVSVTKKVHVSTQNLQKAWKIVRRVSKDDWLEWLRRLSVELLKESPSSALKACGALANSYAPLARALFNAAFLSCWSELNEMQQDELVLAIETALHAPDVPAEVTHTLLNLAEFMEHTEKGPLPLRDDNGIKLLGETATKCRAFAKALHYKELEFHKDPGTAAIGDLININSKLGQADAADGVLLYHEKNVSGNQQSPTTTSYTFKATSKIQGEIGMDVTWYERLHKWEEAKQAYSYNISVVQTPVVEMSQAETEKLHDKMVENKLGYMRCLEALGQWDDLHSFAEGEWEQNSDETYQRRMARLAVAASWGLGKWESMDEYTCMIPREQYDGPFYRAVMALHQNHFVQAKECIDEAREILDSELTALAGESYNRAYSALVNCQMLAELEEVIYYKLVPERRPLIKQAWWDRLQGCERNLEDWQRIIQVRSLVISPHDDMRTWLKFASLCTKNGREGLAKKVLIKLLEMDPSANPNVPLPTTYPYVSFAYMKHMWKQGKQTEAFTNMQQFVSSIQTVPQTLNEEQKSELKHLLSRCFLKLGHWQKSLYGINEDQIHQIIKYHRLATEHDRIWYKAWHSWAVVNFECVQFYKNKVDQPTDQKMQENKKTPVSPVQEEEDSDEDSESSGGIEFDISSVPTKEDYHARLLQYAIPSVRGFFRSIALSAGNSLQDTLRVLTLWFDYGDKQKIYEAVVEDIETIQIENWLQVIPQLIARIDTPRNLVARPVHQLLNDIGKHHPQALIYPLTVASKSTAQSRQKAANTILAKMCEHSDTLVKQAIMVSDELIRVAILWHELWHEGLEEASRLYFGERDVASMLATLEPLHGLLERGPQTLKEISFNQAYGRDLLEAQDWCRKYTLSNNIKDLNQAWDLYYHVFRRITKQLPQLTTLELQYVSPKLMICNDLELAVPGTYNPRQSVVRIKSINSTLQVITSKQRPRKLCILGSNGKEYTFLLKGHEDLRQDERVMQLFGLVNTLLATDRTSSRKNLSIQRYAVIPLSTNSGLIGWVPHCDTLHALIRDYRDKKKILINIEHRIMLRMAPDYDHLTLMQKVEVFEHAVNNTAGDDLAKLLWLKSPSSEIWFDRRTNYTRSLAVMSMVGHVLGLGDRHPSNLMLDRVSGKVLHIDFGDCFEVAMAREKFPEKIPFRLTRMLTNAMEVTGIEGNYRNTCHVVMSVLRQHRESVMTVLEAFVYDPLLNWRLVENVGEKNGRVADVPAAQQTDNMVPNGMNGAGDIRQHEQMFEHPPKISGSEGETVIPEVLNKKAVAIINRVRDKLTGCDFANEVSSLDVPTQVELLIQQATSHENLCQCYIGWCPFW